MATKKRVTKKKTAAQQRRETQRKLNVRTVNRYWAKGGKAATLKLSEAEQAKFEAVIGERAGAMHDGIYSFSKKKFVDLPGFQYDDKCSWTGLGETAIPPKPDTAAEHTAADCAARFNDFEQFRAYNRSDVKVEQNLYDRSVFLGSTPGYESLSDVLTRAYEQAARGKGAERHGRGLSFDAQPTQVISDLLQSDAGLAFQAIKKINEGMRLGKEAKIKEMLGAINYIASLVMYTESHS